MSRRISVLVIEDEKNILDILQYNLESDGFEVILAEDGRSGLELARKKKPDVILLDWMMPEMDGLEVLGELKGNVQTKNILVFMLSAKKRSCHVDAAILGGVDGYFAKPFDPAKMGPTLRHKLEKLVKS
ncbi:PleD family two-component system response regulator [Planctomycetota bacterium]